jgi:hypothetical protein
MHLRASTKWGRLSACHRLLGGVPSILYEVLKRCAEAQRQSRRAGPTFFDIFPQPATLLLVLFAAGLSAAPRFSFHVLGNDPGGWGDLLSSIGLTAGSPAVAGVFVAPHGTDSSTAEWIPRIEHGAILVLEGESPLAAAFGFRPTAEPHVMVQSVEDLRAPALRIIWEKALDRPVFQVPSYAQVFARER